MKLQQLFSFLLTLSGFSGHSSVLVHAKKHGNISIEEEIPFNATPHSSSHPEWYEEGPLNGEGKGRYSLVAVPAPSSSSSLLPRNLKGSKSSPFFFEDCSNICASNGGVATNHHGDCCKGGVSYLKVLFSASQVDVSGTITLDPIVAGSFTNDNNNSPSCTTAWTSKGNKAGSIFGSKGSKAHSSQAPHSRSLLDHQVGPSRQSKRPKASSSFTSRTPHSRSDTGNPSTSGPSRFSFKGSKAASLPSQTRYSKSDAGSSITPQPSSISSKWSKAVSSQSFQSPYSGTGGSSSQASYYSSKGTKDNSFHPSRSPSHRGSKGTKGDIFRGSGLKIVDCEDPCIKFPFEDHTCSSTALSKTKNGVHPGDNICFAMIDSTNQILFDVKMPKKITIWFSSGDGEVLVGAIYTRCRFPLVKPYGISFVNACTPGGFTYRGRKSHVKIDESITDPHLSFIDGISTKYFGSVKAVLAEEDTESYTQDFSIGFETCGCTCEKSNVTSPISDPPSVDTSPNPSSAPSNRPLLSPTKNPSPTPTKRPSLFPTSEVTVTPSTESESPSFSFTSSSSSSSSSTIKVQPGPGSPPTASTSVPSCSSTCVQCLLERCVFAGSTAACDITANAPGLSDDFEEDNAEFATLFPAPLPIVGKGKGIKSKKDFGKGGPEKYVKKTPKDSYRGHRKGGKGRKDGYYFYYSSRAKGRKGNSYFHYSGTGKDEEGGYYFQYSGNNRHLEHIEYHQSRIEYLKELLEHAEE
ncbi:unnamed protein product [Pseudo-nitzschia multistriata]|uniref:Pherophorin domain-containing protein n=1 Tax=Pseudo-nitzschia multistriata TaxID=183589 RepID=A0A448ZBJ1_9STRA|nr:unnamed protein product [Pseudo-nitzschia multistriata]